MKRSLILVGLLLLLVAVWFLFLRKPAEDNIFHIDDLAEVGQIELTKVVKGETAETLTLSRSVGKDWLVNAKYTANATKLDDFLKILTTIRVQNKIDGKGQETAMGLLKRNHTQVRILDRDGGQLKSYLIGATNNQQTSNIMMLEGASRAYLVARPGLEGYVSIFYTTEEIPWRDKSLFEVKGEDLQQVEVAYGRGEGSFKLRRDQADAPWSLGEGVLAEEDRANAYMALFDGKVYAESFVLNDPQLRDSLTRRTPEARLSYQTLDGKTASLLLFARPDNQNNFYGYMEGQPELYTVQHYVIDKFLKGINYFQKTAL